MSDTVVIRVGSDLRECRIENGYYVHVLNSSWRIPVDDRRIEEIY